MDAIDDMTHFIHRQHEHYNTWRHVNSADKFTYVYKPSKEVSLDE